MERILTVTAPPVTTALTTVAAVRAELGAAAVGVLDARLDTLIAQASAAIGTFLQRSPASAGVSEQFRRTGTRLAPALMLSRAPVSAVASVTEDGVALTGAEWELKPETGALYRLEDDGRTFWSGLKVVVAYTGGWTLPAEASPTLPADIERACLVIVSTWFKSAGRDGMLRSESADGISAQSWLDPDSRHGGLPFQAAVLLQDFIRPAL